MEKTKNIIKKSGAVLFRERDGEKDVLLEYRDREYHDWTFPKGGMEDGETAEVTAVRELREETGYNIEVLQELPDIRYEFDEGKVIQHMFLAKVIDGHLTPEFKSDRLKWVPIEEAENLLTHQDLKDYLSKITALKR